MTIPLVNETPDVAPHPFDNPRLMGIVRKYAPEYEIKLRSATRPKSLSENPSDLQKWESKQILTRKQQKPGLEDDYLHLVRTLYEETFLVAGEPQEKKPGVLFDDKQHITLGGLISHHLCRSIMDGVGVEDVIKYDLRGTTLVEALVNEPSAVRREAILTFTQEQSPKNNFNVLSPTIISNLAKDPYKYKIPGFMNVYGFRLLQVLKNVPELTQPIKDPELKKIIGYNEQNEINVAEFIQALWHKIGNPANSPILTTDRGFKHEDDPNAIDGLKILLMVRTHPELQIIYQYLSPSGYIDKFTKE